MLQSSIVLKYRLCLKRFPSYVIPPYRAVSFVVVRHHRLGGDYWAAIWYQIGFIALSRFGGVYLRRTDDAFRGWRPKTGSFTWSMRSLILSIYVRSFDPFFWISNKYMASGSSAKSLSFYFHTGLGHNFNTSRAFKASDMLCLLTIQTRANSSLFHRPIMVGLIPLAHQPSQLKPTVQLDSSRLMVHTNLVRKPSTSLEFFNGITIGGWTRINPQ